MLEGKSISSWMGAEKTAPVITAVNTTIAETPIDKWVILLNDIEAAIERLPKDIVRSVYFGLPETKESKEFIINSLKEKFDICLKD